MGKFGPWPNLMTHRSAWPILGNIYHFVQIIHVQLYRNDVFLELKRRKFLQNLIFSYFEEFCHTMFFKRLGDFQNGKYQSIL